ncbi:MAG: hypothetical protein IT365_01340 [Candidatus Hydrogenedentes bacterium]|nr:hypothetical protein [Candidatus Hydrogenedentota bacterium]
MPRLLALSVSAVLLCMPALRVSGQVNFERGELDAWLQQERPEWTEAQRAGFLDILERQRETVLNTLPPESAAHVLKYAPDTALQQTPLHFESSVTLEIMEEKYALLLDDYASRPPLNQDEQKRLDEQFTAVEEAVVTTLSEVAEYLPDQESLDEFKRITEEGLQNMRFAAANPLDPNFKSVLTDAELASLLETIAAKGQLSSEDLQAELAEIEEKRDQGLPAELLTLDGISVYIDRVITSTEEMTEYPYSDRLRQLERKGMEEETERSKMHSIASWLERERRFPKFSVESDPPMSPPETNLTDQTLGSAKPPDPDVVTDGSSDLVLDERLAASAPEAKHTDSSLGGYIALCAIAAIVAAVGGYLSWRRRSSHG